MSIFRHEKKINQKKKCIILLCWHKLHSLSFHFVNSLYNKIGSSFSIFHLSPPTFTPKKWTSYSNIKNISALLVWLNLNMIFFLISWMRKHNSFWRLCLTMQRKEFLRPIQRYILSFSTVNEVLVEKAKYDIGSYYLNRQRIIA